MEFSKLIYDPSSLEDMPLFKLGKEANKLPQMGLDPYYDEDEFRKPEGEGGGKLINYFRA